MKALILIVSVWFLLSSKSSIEASEKKIYKLAYPKTLSMGLIVVAKQNHLFEKYGIMVHHIQTMSGKEANDLLFSNKSDFAAAYGSVVVKSHLNKLPQRVYCRLHSSRRNTGVLGLKTNGIKRPRDFSGKKIAVSLNTSAHFFLESWLESHLVGREQVILFDSGPEKHLDLLETNQVDGAASWEPYLSVMKNTLRKKTTEIFYSNFYQENSFLISRREAKFNEAASKMVRALYDALQVALVNPAAAYEATLQEFRMKDSPELRASWQKQHFQLNFSNYLFSQLRFQKDWLVSRTNEYIVDNSRLTDDFYFRALRQISPYLVTVSGVPAE